TVSAIENLLAPVLVGRDPREVRIAREAMDRALKGNPFTKAAVEMALWDLSGKSAGLPLYQLLGGKVRDRIPIKLMIGAFDPAQAVRLAETFLGWGARCLKVKVGIDLERDLARLRAVRETAGAEIPITVDANGGWDLATAGRALPQIEPFNI